MSRIQRQNISMPPLGLSVNYFHPIARELTTAWIQNEQVGGYLNNLAGRYGGLEPRMNLRTGSTGPTWTQTHNARGASMYPRGRSLYFDGADYATSPHCNAYSWSASLPFSAYVWYKINGGTNELLLDKLEGSTTYRGWQILQIQTAGSENMCISLIYDNASSDSIARQTTNEYNDDKWHGSLFTYDGSLYRTGFHIYTDGIEDTLQYGNAGPITADITNSQDLNIGRRRSSDSLYLTGSLGLVYIWKRELKYQEAILLHDDPLCIMQPLYARVPYTTVVGGTYYDRAKLVNAGAFGSITRGGYVNAST